MIHYWNRYRCMANVTSNHTAQYIIEYDASSNNYSSITPSSFVHMVSDDDIFWILCWFASLIIAILALFKCMNSIDSLHHDQSEDSYELTQSSEDERVEIFHQNEEETGTIHHQKWRYDHLNLNTNCESTQSNEEPIGFMW